jgi:outer membrane protein assembly factor BamB
VVDADVTKLLGGDAKAGYVFRNRGVCYANGVVYVGRGLVSVRARRQKTGKPVPTFGNNGQASVILDVVKMRYPEVSSAITLGYWFTTAPQYNGVLYIGSTRSESHIPGGHVLAVDAKTGKVLWHFNTIPQDEKIRAGTSRDRHGSEARETAAASGKR